MDCEVSIIVRSHNDESFIRQTLKRLSHQNSTLTSEILSCDDHSTDRTPQIIGEFPHVRRIPPPDGPYVPGKVLNHAVREAKGTWVIFNNADAIPLDANYLQTMIQPFSEHPELKAVYANQLPRKEAAYLVQKDHLRAFGDGTVSAKWNFFFSLAGSAARREDLLREPFREDLQYSEDVEWAYRMKCAGGTIRYLCNARVEHSHNYTLSELQKRFYNEGLAAAQIFGKRVSMSEVLRQTAMEVLRDFFFLLPRPYSWCEIAGSPLRRWIQKREFMRGCNQYLNKQEKDSCLPHK